MSDFMGEWTIKTVSVDSGNGSSTPQVGSNIRIGEERDPGEERSLYRFSFFTPDKLNSFFVTQDGPYHLTRHLPAEIEGYSLDVFLDPADPAFMKGWMAHHGDHTLDEVDIATFTATKTTQLHTQ